jgi:hypothetical protein
MKKKLEIILLGFGLLWGEIFGAAKHIFFTIFILILLEKNEEERERVRESSKRGRKTCFGCCFIMLRGGNRYGGEDICFSLDLFAFAIFA